MESIKNPATTWHGFLKSIWFGIIAGLISGMVKIGWEKILPPRTLARDLVNPPQHMLQQMGASYKFTHSYLIYNTDQKVFWVALILHFSFSIFFAWLFIYMAQFEKTKWISLWQGAFYGILIWIVWHILLMPALGTTPTPWNMPFAEHFSEFFGHIVWAWAIAATAYYLIDKQKVKTLTNKYL